MISIIFLWYFFLSVQLVCQNSRLIKTQYLACLCLSFISFNYHSHLLSHLSVLWS